MRSIFLLIFLFSSSAIICQAPADTLNKYNENKKKDGFWLVYLTDRLLTTKERSEAFYYGYNYYNNGESPGFFPWATKDKKNASKVVKDGMAAIKGNPILLSGNIKFYDKKGNLSFNETYKDGVPVIIEAFSYNRKGECAMREILDYADKYKDQKFSSSYKKYTCDGKIISENYYAQDEKEKWTLIKYETSTGH